MKIAYFIYWLDGLESGVIKKITDQITYWSDQNNTVKLFIYTKKGAQLEQDVNSQKYTLPFQIELIFFEGRLSKVLNSYKVYHIINNFHPDIIYMRETLFYPGVYKLTKQYKTIVEINSIAKNEVNHKSLKYWYNKFTHKLKFKAIRALVTVTYEIANHEQFNTINVPKYTIGNAINLDKIPPLAPINNKTPNLVFIGTDKQIWHGVDKIVTLAKLKPQWNFHLIGISNTDTRYQNLPNIIFHGKLNKMKYEKIYYNADIAIGTLALHRIKMQEACALKTREYLAYGLPVIIAYDDVDFMEEKDFICKLPNIEDNITNNIQKIENFILKWKGKRINRAEIIHIDVKEKEKKRLAVFNKIL
jgi:hypothetical protein